MLLYAMLTDAVVVHETSTADAQPNVLYTTIIHTNTGMLRNSRVLCGIFVVSSLRRVVCVKWRTCLGL